MVEGLIEEMQVPPARSPMFARCERAVVRGWLRWLSTEGLPERVLRMRRLMPEGVPVFVVYKGASLRESMFALDEGRLQSGVVATVRVMGYMQAMDEDKFRAVMLRQAMRMFVHDSTTMGLEL